MVGAAAIPSGPLAAAMRAARGELNARFAQARRRMPGLDPDAFGAFVLAAVGPIVEAVAAVAPDRAGEVAYATYDVALELVGERLAGAGARDPRVGAAWSALLAAVPRLIVSDPTRVTVATANALMQIAATPNADAEGWATGMSRLAPAAPDLTAWLSAGQVLAWRAGLAHYRSSALEILARLPAALALRIFELTDGADWPAVLAKLVADPWFDPGRPETQPRVAARVGAFSGFGGLFSSPPMVAGGGALVAASGDDAWLLCADARGATFHRATDAERHAARPLRSLPSEAASLALPVRGAVTSVARAGSTLAVTCADSHTIVLVALPVGA